MGRGVAPQTTFRNTNAGKFDGGQKLQGGALLRGRALLRVQSNFVLDLQPPAVPWRCPTHCVIRRGIQCCGLHAGEEGSGLGSFTPWTLLTPTPEQPRVLVWGPQLPHREL